MGFSPGRAEQGRNKRKSTDRGDTHTENRTNRLQATRPSAPNPPERKQNDAYPQYRRTISPRFWTHTRVVAPQNTHTHTQGNAWSRRLAVCLIPQNKGTHYVVLASLAWFTQLDVWLTSVGFHVLHRFGTARSFLQSFLGRNSIRESEQQVGCVHLRSLSQQPGTRLARGKHQTAGGHACHRLEIIGHSLAIISNGAIISGISHDQTEHQGQYQGQWSQRKQRNQNHTRTLAGKWTHVRQWRAITADQHTASNAMGGVWHGVNQPERTGTNQSIRLLQAPLCSVCDSLIAHSSSVC